MKTSIIKKKCEIFFRLVVLGYNFEVCVWGGGGLCGGVNGYMLTWLTSMPAAIKAWTISVWPLTDASIKALMPFPCREQPHVG